MVIRQEGYWAHEKLCIGMLMTMIELALYGSTSHHHCHLHHLSLSLHFNGHSPGEPDLAGVY